MTCNKCKLKTEDNSLFVKRKDRSSGYRNICKNCHRKRGKKYNKKHRKNRREIIREAKNKPCTDCGIKYPYYVMDFDHREDKKFSISSAPHKYTIQEILDEIKKCEVVCSNCHRQRTHKENKYRK